MRILLVFVAACASESGGGGGNTTEQRSRSWSARLEQPALTYDATTVQEYTFEASINLTRSYRRFGAYSDFNVHGEVLETRVGNGIEMTVSIDGQAPDASYGTRITRGTYTHGSESVSVLRPLETCMVGPCSATERYRLRLATKTLADGPVEVKWTAELRIVLPYEYGERTPPYSEEGEALTLVLVPETSM